MQWHVGPQYLRILPLLVPGVARCVNERRLRRSQFTGRLSHVVTVPPGPGDRPGERLVGPSRAFFPPTVAACGSRNDLVVALGRRARLTVVCLGTLADRGDPWSSWQFTIGRLAELGIPCVAGPSLTRIADEHAVRYSYALSSGVRRRPGDDEASRLGEVALETWSWIDEPAGP